MSPSFNPGTGFAGVATFGRNEFLRSTNPKPQTESYTCAMDSVPLRVVPDQGGTSNQRVLQPGTAMAKITSGPNAGLIGPYQAAGTAEQQTITKSGTWTSVTGTYRLGVTGSAEHVDVPVAATNTDVAAALNGLDALGDWVVSASGGPLGSSPLVLTFTGDDGTDVPAITFDPALIVGGTSPNAAVTQSTAPVAGSTDGRGVLANLVGLELTFLPWTLLVRDVEVSVVTNCTAVQAWCFELDAAGNQIPLSNTVADALRSLKRLDINFS